MFDRFFSTKAPGRGLGLAAALGVVRGHRGQLEVQSAPGEGTAVRLYLPASPRTAGQAPAPAPPEDGRPGGTILVVEDDSTLRAAVERALAANGFGVLTACDGSEAVELFRVHASQIEAVLLDLTLPGLSGAEVLPALRALRRDVPVVVWSGYSDAEIAAHFAGAAPDAVLAKPLQPKDPFAALRSAIESRRG